MCPFEWSAAIVKTGERNRFSEYYGIFPPLTAIHLVGQGQHCKVEFNLEKLAETCDSVETPGVDPYEMDRDDVSAVLHAFVDEGLSPGDILNLSVNFSGAEPGWKHYHLIASGKSFVYKAGEVAGLTSELVYGNEQRRNRLDVHQQAVSEEFDVSIVFFSKDCSHSHSVYSSERMVGNECKSAAFRDILNPFDGNFYTESVESSLAEINPFTSLFKIAVDEVLMNELLNQPISPSGNLIGFGPGLCFDYSGDIKGLDIFSV